MARIFLSYAREDAAKAGTLVRALERAGHKVWWDRQVGGATRFAREIAAALKDAEAVIVLWSRSSIDSEWVQDEAAEGRDSGRFVPITLDNSLPPLGFRQVQAIDLSRWSGRGKVPDLPRIEGAIGIVLRGGKLPRAKERPRRPLVTHWLGTSLVALLLLIAGAWIYGTGRLATRAEAAGLAVLPFSDLSPGRDKQYFAEGVTEDIRTLLSTVPGVKVIGRTSIGMLGQGAGFKQAREQLGVTHMLEGSMRIDGDQMRLNVRLLRTADGLQIWAEQFDRDLKEIFRVQNEIGTKVAEHLRWRLWAPTVGDRAETSIEVYDLVLESYSKMEVSFEQTLEAHRLAQKAVKLDPDYSPAWVALSRTVHILDQMKPAGWGGPQWPAQRERALGYARRAVSLDPRNADAQAFLAWAEADGERPELALPRIQKAISLNPGQSSVWGIAGYVYDQFCEPQKQLEAWRRFAALEPLGPERLHLMTALYATGHTAEANEWRRKLARSEWAEAVEAELALDRGDLSSVLAPRLKKEPHGQGRDLATILNALGKTELAVERLPSGFRDSLGAYWARDFPKAAAQIGFIPTTRWNNVRTIVIERALVHSGRHRELLAMFDQRFGSVEEFDRRTRCYLPSHAAPIVIMLRRAGRSAEADRLIGLAERRYRQSLKDHTSSSPDHAGYIQLLVVAGRHGEALGALERAQRMPGAWGSGPPVVWLNLHDPIYDPIRGDTRFKAVERRIAAWRAKELRELAAAGIRIN